jgi:hypothetical protein
MKVLHTLVFASDTTPLDKFKAFTADKPQISVTYLSNIEAVIERINARLDDMLVFDTSLPAGELKKVNKMVALIAPELATIDVHMNDEDFINIKMNQMIQKWQEAGSTNPAHKFWDNPGL